ncbi:hypothetical protein JoomaDRAFT_3472 [Galbibacter orientalis DSM 19592]|uniref:Uncharacterized protein n=1 Tax=Galbibacter orientalis DSM 19592 TaxID=926559 RepID=I3C9X1_9FLAO|nr:hypothetical protein [Galbibacter orientalis]EIJ40414.1 hypothetical protein JoomaDRAFT_3472 [Galbibacter orientalis DSM 19592]
MIRVYLMLFLFSIIKVSSQDLSHGKAITYNVIGSSLFSGIGSAINKKENEKLGHAFLKGLWQGAIGGTVIYGSKNIIQGYANTGSPLYAWSSKLVNAAGTSITENAASNIDFWKRWHLNIGFTRFEYHLNPKKAGRSFYFKVMPYALGRTIYVATKGDFDINTSLKTGNLVFSTNTSPANYVAFAYTYTILYDRTKIDGVYNNKTNVIAHEIIHVYQVDDFITINSYFNKLYSKNTFVNDKLLNWIYPDINSWTYIAAYNITGDGKDDYDSNYFEQEAILFSE